MISTGDFPSILPTITMCLFFALRFRQQYVFFDRFLFFKLFVTYCPALDLDWGGRWGWQWGHRFWRVSTHDGQKDEGKGFRSRNQRSICRFWSGMKDINQSINQSNSQSVNQSIDQSINQSIYQSINQSINQWINQSIKSQSNNLSINQSINQSINKPINQSINQSINPSINQQIDQSINQ